MKTQKAACSAKDNDIGQYYSAPKCPKDKARPQTNATEFMNAIWSPGLILIKVAIV